MVFLSNFDVNDFCSFCPAPALKRISYWKCFITVGTWKHLHWLTGIAIFATVGPLNSWENKSSVESNQVSTCIKSTLMMSRNDFNLYRVDLYRNDFVSKWPNSVSRPGLAGGSLLLLVVSAVPLGLLSATVHGVPPGVPRLREAFPGGQHHVPIPTNFMSLLHVSLNHSLGRPLGLEAPESSPYSRSLDIRPSSIL